MLAEIISRLSGYHVARSSGTQLTVPIHGVCNDTFKCEMKPQRQDGETEFAIRVTRKADARNRIARGVTCRIFMSDETVPTLFAAFGVSGFRVAMPEDFAGQDEENSFMATVLEKVFHASPENSQSMLNAFREQWAATRDRLLGYRGEARFGDWTPDALILVRDGRDTVPALSSSTTRMNDRDVFTLRKENGRYKPSSGTPKIVARTTADVAALPDISGHAKLDLLKILNDKQEYREAREAFEAYRKVSSLPFPVRSSGAFAIGLPHPFDYYARFANGDVLSLYDQRLHAMQPSPGLRARLRDETKCSIFEVTIPRGKEAVLSMKPGAKQREATSDALDERLRRFFAAVLALDKPVPNRHLPSPPPRLCRNHPALVGLDVPARHSAFFATLLGSPYELMMATLKAT